MTSSTPRIIAIVPAGGVGARAATGFPKQYRKLLGEPMLRWTVRALLADLRIEQLRVAVAPGDTQAEDVLRDMPRTVCRPCGGPTRAATVLGALRDAALHADDWVLVHDAARPGLPADALGRLIDACLVQGDGGLLAIPVADTVKRAADDARVPVRVQSSVPRDNLWLAQTPQMFRAAALQAALESAESCDDVTDEASALERLGHCPMLVQGAMVNFKVTWPADFELMESVLARSAR